MASSAQANPYLKALLHIGWVTLTLAVLFAMAGASEASYFGASAGATQFAIAAWLASVGSLAMLLWLFAGAIVWRPGTRPRARPRSDARSSKSVWGAD
ncbi:MULTISPECIES: hypothetical protein [unclassified Cryobacterium]|uniref:hypothetical protein n=1 Tax=unclassified Cryobacterium TaxID=2649013 RepID=UPI001447C38F|nr:MULTISPECIES: hypothetical protein [unclassified Cryobacterium]